LNSKAATQIVNEIVAIKASMVVAANHSIE
jgi:hypothetical protein